MASGESKTFVVANERVLILLLCVAAAVRVLIFSAAFPFFSNIDEDLHFDLITQYSHAQPGWNHRGGQSYGREFLVLFENEVERYDREEHQ